MTANADNTALVKRKIHMSLHPAVNCDTTVSEDGFSLIAADTIQTVHDKVEQFIRLHDLTDNGLIIVARHAVVMLSSHNRSSWLWYDLMSFINRRCGAA
jgi:hypothetical protein